MEEQRDKNLLRILEACANNISYIQHRMEKLSDKEYNEAIDEELIKHLHLIKNEFSVGVLAGGQ